MICHHCIRLLGLRLRFLIFFRFLPNQPPSNQIISNQISSYKNTISGMVTMERIVVRT